MNFPKITIAIPTYNEEGRIEDCLRSVFGQSYPHEKLEVIVVDDSSTDNTINIAKKFPVKVFTHNFKDPEVAKKIAFDHSTGDFFVYLDADIHLKGKEWFQKMIRPLINDESIAAAFTKYYSDLHSTPIEKFLNLDPLQRDPIYQFFSPSLAELVINDNQDYKTLEYKLEKIPPAGLCVHRRTLIEPLLKGKDRFLELDLLVSLVENDHKFFAYVPTAGLFHHHATTLWNLLQKRSRNVTQVYLKDNSSRKYRWFNLRTWGGFSKVVFWILYVNLFLPELLRGIYKSIKYQTWVGLYEPVVALLATDVIIVSFLMDSRGRKILS